MTPGELGALLPLTSGSVTALMGRRKIVVSLTAAAWRFGQDELAPDLEAVDAATRRQPRDGRAVVSRHQADVVDRIHAARRSGARQVTAVRRSPVGHPAETGACDGRDVDAAVNERIVVSPGCGVFSPSRGPGAVEVGTTLGFVRSGSSSVPVVSRFRGELVSMVAVAGERLERYQRVAWLRLA